MSSTISLKIYGDDDEVIAEFKTSRIRWGVVEDVIALQEKLEGQTEKVAIGVMAQFLQLIFPTLTSEMMRKADVNDIKMCFKQLGNVVKNIEGTEEKNV